MIHVNGGDTMAVNKTSDGIWYYKVDWKDSRGKQHQTKNKAKNGEDRTPRKQKESLFYL